MAGPISSENGYKAEAPRQWAVSLNVRGHVPVTEDNTEARTRDLPSPGPMAATPFVHACMPACTIPLPIADPCKLQTRSLLTGQGVVPVPRRWRIPEHCYVISQCLTSGL